MTSRGNTSAPRKRYLAKTEQIQTDNGYRMRWNREVDRAIVSGVAETEIQQIKKKYILDHIKESIDIFGSQPERFGTITSWRSRCCTDYGTVNCRRRERNNSGRMLWGFSGRYRRLVFLFLLQHLDRKEHHIIICRHHEKAN